MGCGLEEGLAIVRCGSSGGNAAMFRFHHGPDVPPTNAAKVYHGHQFPHIL